MRHISLLNTSARRGVFVLTRRKPLTVRHGQRGEERTRTACSPLSGVPAQCRVLSVYRVTSRSDVQCEGSSLRASLCFSPLTSLSFSFSHPSLGNLTSGYRTCPSNHTLHHWMLNLDPTVIPWDSVSLIMAGLLDVITHISYS